MIITDKKKIVGAHILAPAAGEMIHEFALAIEEGVKLNELAQFMHVYPTYRTSIGQLAGRGRVREGREAPLARQAQVNAPASVVTSRSMPVERLENSRWGFDSNCFVCEPANRAGCKSRSSHDTDRGRRVRRLHAGRRILGGTDATCTAAPRSHSWTRA